MKLEKNEDKKTGTHIYRIEIEYGDIVGCDTRKLQKIMRKGPTSISSAIARLAQLAKLIEDAEKKRENRGQTDNRNRHPEGGKETEGETG